MTSNFYFRQETNLIEALSVGATMVIKLIAYVVVNFKAFISILAFLDDVLGYLGSKVNFPELSFRLVCSYVFMPLAAMIGVDWADSRVVGALIGKKDLSAILATYLLCGFGSIPALGVNLGALTSDARPPLRLRASHRARDGQRKHRLIHNRLRRSVIYDWVQNILWKWKYNVKGYFPLPILGTLPFQLSNPTPDGERSRINRFGKIYGGSLGMINIINVCDIDILKKILVKDHADFQNRFTLPGVYEPPPSDATLLALKDSEWKRVRSILTPSFSAAKLKMMTTNINHVSEILARGLLENARSRSTIDPKDIYGCFTMDVIARTAFGIETNSYKNPDDPFIAHGKRVFSSPVFNPVIILMMIFPRLGPFLTRLLKYSMFFPTNSLEFFIDVSKQIIEQRKTDITTGRVDLLQLMLNSEHDVHKSLSVNEIVSQSFIVFVAGYETTATLLTYASYVLATNPDVQNTLQEEIDRHIPRDCKEIIYEKVMELPYLDQFIHETLRMYPPVTA
ncbi:hypothetical protein DPMN_066097, partial [Dreissena polymorpha]